MMEELYLKSFLKNSDHTILHPLYANMPNHPLDLFHLLNSSELALGSTTVNFQSIQNSFLTSFIEAKTWSNVIKVSDAFLDFFLRLCNHSRNLILSMQIPRNILLPSFKIAQLSHIHICTQRTSQNYRI